MSNKFDQLKSIGAMPDEATLQTHLRIAASVFEVEEAAVQFVRWLQGGMTNKSFLLTVNDECYIYRIPGPGSERYISRKQESDVYAAIKQLDISEELIFFNPESGVKIALYYPDAYAVDDQCESDLKDCMDILRKLHNSKVSVEQHFDIEEKLTKFEIMFREKDCAVPNDLNITQTLLKKALEIIRTSDAPKVLCHVDCVNANFVKCRDNRIRLLDWEYSGMCHAIADIAMFALNSRYSPERCRQLLCWYLLREPEKSEWQLCVSYIATAGLLWFFWASYRESFGENFLDYTSAVYQSAKDFVTLLH